MFTCNRDNNTPCVVKLSQFLRYYENVHGIRLSPEMAEQEAVKAGFLIDYAGESKIPARNTSKLIEPNSTGITIQHGRDNLTGDELVASEVRSCSTNVK